MQALQNNATHKSGVFSRIWEENRRNFVSDLVDIQSWERLDAMLGKSGAEIIIMASRRMPRAVCLLRSFDQHLFSSPDRFYSDFALEFLGDSLEGKNVAIVDDAVNVGSTMWNIRERVNKYNPSQVECFAIARRAGGPKAGDGQLRVSYASATDLTEEEYRKRITKLSQALWVLNLPLELEFPVYRHRLESSFLVELPGLLEDRFGKGFCHRLDIAQASYLGLHRYSVDLDPGHGINNKIRLYADEKNGELVITPMAHCLPHGHDLRAWRAERFKASLSLYDIFAKKLNLPEHAAPSGEDAALLFGTPDYQHFLAEVEVDGAPRYRTNFYNSEWGNLRDRCLATPDRWSLDSCFRMFFKALAEYVGENNQTDYDRLRHGPTFGELLEIMREMWTIDSVVPPTEIHKLLSSMLDHYIDLGFIVPVLDENGFRRFRKGEPYPWNDSAMQILNFMGVAIKPGENMELAINSLSSDDRELFAEMWSALQAMTTGLGNRT